jgi:hypothetical protein
MTRIGIRTRESKGGGKGRGTVFSTAGGMCWEEESGERGNGERCAGMNPDDYRCRYVRIISASSILVSCKDRALETVASGGGKRDHSHLYERRAYAIHIRSMCLSAHIVREDVVWTQRESISAYCHFAHKTFEVSTGYRTKVLLEWRAESMMQRYKYYICPSRDSSPLHHQASQR